MHLLELLWNIIRTYLNYRKNMQAIRSGKGHSSTEPMMRAFMKGDYRAAFFKTVDPFFKGCLMMQMGQIGPALVLVKHVADGARDPRAGALANNVLGQLFLEDRQYERAIECLRTSQVLWQERGGADRLMAEVWLRRGENSEEALRLARRGLEKERAHPGMSVDSKNSSLCEQLGTAAWAIAVGTKDTAEVDRLVNEAVMLNSGIPVCSIGLMHLHAGHAYVALGNAEKSAQHFDEAARIDPNGLAGRAAAAMAVASRR